MSTFIEQLPLWLSLVVLVIGVAVSIKLAFFAYKGILFGFSLLMTAGIVIFGFHHLVELGDHSLRSLAQILEAAASATFLLVAVYMLHHLRTILNDDKVDVEEESKHYSHARATAFALQQAVDHEPQGPKIPG